jgi:hypothetical protein
VPLPVSRRTELIRRQRARRASTSEPARLAKESRHRRTVIHTPLQVGKYLVSPLTRLDDRGRHAASVSIRTGRGSATHDRVLRFFPAFDSSDQAARYALAQGLAWLGAAPAPVIQLSTNQD